MLQTRFPRPLGDIGHPDSLPFEVKRRVVQGATPALVVRGNDPALLEPFVAAGRALVDEGALAITTSCGFLARWQSQLQEALPVPVWTSSLLQLAQLQEQNTEPSGCGVITIDAASLSPALLLAVDADPATPVEGISPGSPLYRSLLQDLPELDMVDAEQQVLAAARRLMKRCPGLHSVVLECTNLPPYAEALRTSTGLRVLDILTLLQQRMPALLKNGRC